MTRGRLLCAVLAAVLAVVWPGAPAPTASAEDAPLPPATPGPPPADAPPLVTPGGVPLAPPGANEAGRRRLQADLKVLERELRAATVAQRRSARLVPELAARRQSLAARLAELGEEERVATEALVSARAQVREMAVAGYVVGGSVPPVDYLLRSADADEFLRRSQLVRSATERRADVVETYEHAKREVGVAIEATVAELDRAAAAERAAARAADAGTELVERLTADLAHRRQLLDVLTAAAPVGSSDIPRLFLDAYRQAADELRRRVPHCRVSWFAVAAIGKVESNHGRYRGAQLALNGDVYPRIVGIPLDGTRGTRRIDDTDDGLLDLDQVYDRAVGPMQFIPSTWKRIAQDANRDGAKDPNNAYDAALATATYLCRAVPSGGLDLEEALRRAYFSYNHSDAYVDHVYRWKVAFEALAPTL
ncbi:MAG TPA: lytic murein transglycosylase [Acidimicrobiales bacterium]|nr:lytic murein transglycosylase [Acidimicrobiales bacterium]